MMHACNTVREKCTLNRSEMTLKSIVINKVNLVKFGNLEKH